MKATNPERRKALVAGFFSTVGDIECLNVVRRWLDQLRFPYDVAPYRDHVRNAMPGTVDPLAVDAKNYTHLVIVCGPCWSDLFDKGALNLAAFDHCVRIGVNLTMIAPLEQWNPFDVLFERESSRTCRPDLAFLGSVEELPVVGRCLFRQQQKEYGDRQQFALAERAINNLIANRKFGVIDIDTHWSRTAEPWELPTPASVHSLMKRTDFVMTNRLHGMVFALKAGIPVIALDGIAGGGKVTAQARAIGWPLITLGENATPEWMDRAANWCLTTEARQTAATCRDHLLPSLREVEQSFLATMVTKEIPAPLPRVTAMAKPSGIRHTLKSYFSKTLTQS